MILNKVSQALDLKILQGFKLSVTCSWKCGFIGLPCCVMDGITSITCMSSACRRAAQHSGCRTDVTSSAPFPALAVNLVLQYCSGRTTKHYQNWFSYLISAVSSMAQDTLFMVGWIKCRQDLAKGPCPGSAFEEKQAEADFARHCIQ